MSYPISLPVVPPRALDSSTLSTFQRCPRKAFYSYWLNRTPVGDNYPIMFGVAYHKFREVLELGVVGKLDTVDDLKHYQRALAVALELFPNDPPLGHKKEFLTRQRLIETCEQAYEGWLREKRKGDLIVVATEQPFELKLPNGEPYGGRIDQIVEWSRALYIRDFKTTSMMGNTYANQFDPNAQFTGYVWGAQTLSGRTIRGVMVETVYNTKRTGPEHHPFLSTRTVFALDEWKLDVVHTIKQIRDCEEKSYFPKHTTACGDYGGCVYRECCKLSTWPARTEWLEGHTVESHWDFAAPDKEGEKIDR